MNTHTVLSFIHSFHQAKTIAEITTRLTTALSTYGITTYSFTYYAYHPRSIQKLIYAHCSESFLPWHEHYLSENYNEIDTTLHDIYQETLPFVWNLEAQLSAAKTQREQQMREDSIAFGAIGGLSIPLHAPLDDFASLTLVNMKKDTWFNNVPQIQYELQIIATTYFHHLRALLLNETYKDVATLLSQRELQCLSLTAKRHSVEAIAKKLSITPRTVNFHLQNINKKLGTSNKYESVNIAQSKAILLS